MNKQDFMYLIVEQLAEHPEWTPDAFQAVTEGAREAHTEMLRRMGTLSQGLLASMSFISPTRMSPGMKKIAADKIMAAYDVQGGTAGLAPCEIKAIVKIASEVRKVKTDG